MCELQNTIICYLNNWPFPLTIVHIMIYSLTSSSSENLHELLSSVIILEHVQIAESASMSCVVSAAWNTLSSATGSEMERLCQRLFSGWWIFTMKCTSTCHEGQSGITINGNNFFLYIGCIHCTVYSKINFLPSVLPPSPLPPKAFPVASSTNSMVASLWICMSTVYKPCTVFLAHQCLLVQIHPHLPINGKSNVHLFSGVSWNRGKWKAGSYWGLKPRASGQNCQCSELQPTVDHQLL